MKNLLIAIISLGLGVASYAQTRSVLVDTNNRVVQPTNFWSADASNAKTGLGLGTAATSSVTDFQPSSSALTNLASSNGGSLTNLQATNLVGTIPSSNIPSVTFTGITGTLSIAQGGTAATNASDARANFGSTAVGDALFTASNASSARTTLGATTLGENLFGLANPSNITFLRVNSNNTVSTLIASDFRTAIGLGTAATNASSAFQPYAAILDSLSSSNALLLTNIQAVNISGTVSLVNGGTGATNALGARAALGLGSAATNPASAFQPSSLALSNLANNNGGSLTNITIANVTGLLATNGDGSGLTNLTAANITGTVALATNVTGVVAITNGGTGATNAATARTNLGATTIGNSLFTATNAQAAFDALGIGTNLSTSIIGVSNIVVSSFTAGSALGFVVPTSGQTLAVRGTNLTTSVPAFFGWDGFIQTAFSAEQARTNIGLASSWLTNTNTASFRSDIGLGWSALTNTNTGTGLVSVDTNGEVISPTNFWQQAPIASTYQESIPVTNSTNFADSSRSLHLHSLSPSINNVTNVILLRTNGTTFAGDNATIVHKGPTNSMTVVRSAGGTNDLITMTRFNEAVKFVYYGSVWNLDHNLSYVEPIYFAGTNTVAHIAETRTNLGLPLTALTNTNNANFQAAVFVTNSAPTNSANVNTVNFNTATHWMEVTVKTNGTNATFRIPLFQ